MSAVRFVIALVATVAVAAGCSNSPAGPRHADQVASTTPAPAVSEPKIMSFGSTHTFTDGIRISVSAPVHYERTEADIYYGICETDCPTTGARMTVTVTNGSTEAFDPVMLGGTATLNGQPIQSLAFTPAPEGELGGTGTLLPGQDQTYDQLYWVTEPGDFVIQYNHIPAPMTSEDVYFRGDVSDNVVTVIRSPEPAETEAAEVETDYCELAGVPAENGQDFCEDLYYGDGALPEEITSDEPKYCFENPADPTCTPTEGYPNNYDETDIGLVRPEDDPNFVPPMCSETITESCTPSG